MITHIHYLMALQSDGTLTRAIDIPHSDIYFFGKVEGDWFITKDGYEIYDVDTSYYRDEFGKEQHRDKIAHKWEHVISQEIRDSIEAGIKCFVNE